MTDSLFRYNLMTSHGHGHGHGHEQPKINEFEPKLLLKKPEFYEFLAQTFFADQDPVRQEELMRDQEFLERAAKLFEKKSTIAVHLKTVIREKIIDGLGLEIGKDDEAGQALLKDRLGNVDSYLHRLFRLVAETGDETEVNSLLADVEKHKKTHNTLKAEREKFSALKAAYEANLKSKDSLKHSQETIKAKIQHSKDDLRETRPIPLTPKELLSVPKKLLGMVKSMAHSFKGYLGKWKEDFALHPVKTTFSLPIEPFKAPFKLAGYGFNNLSHILTEWSHASDNLKNAKDQLKTNKLEQRKAKYFGKKMETDFLAGQSFMEAHEPNMETEAGESQEQIINHINLTSDILAEAKLRLSGELLDLIRNPETSPEDLQKKGLARLKKIRARQTNVLTRIASFTHFEMDGQIVSLADIISAFTLEVIEKTANALRTKLSAEPGKIVDKEFMQKTLSHLELADFKIVARGILLRLKEQRGGLSIAQKLSVINTENEIEGA